MVTESAPVVYTRDRHKDIISPPCERTNPPCSAHFRMASLPAKGLVDCSPPTNFCTLPVTNCRRSLSLLRAAAFTVTYINAVGLSNHHGVAACSLMGAHGTVEDALSNIAAFNAAAAQKARQDKKTSRESKKAAKEKSKKHKHKKSSKRKRDDSSDSDSDQGPISATEQIARSQAAVRSLREILERHGQVRKDLRLVRAQITYLERLIPYLVSEMHQETP